MPEIPDFHDKKFDDMTYKELVEYVISHYNPYVFDDKIIEGFRTNNPMCNRRKILKEAA